MCEQCDRPELTEQECAADLRQRIERNRFCVVSVHGSVRVAELSYTVGLTQHGAPELVVTGMRRDMAVRVLRMWGDYLLDDSVVLAGETLESGPWLLEAVQVVRPREHLLAADRLYGDRLLALQLAWADRSGRMPWEPGHSARRAGQPLLGEPAPWFCPDHDPRRLDVPPHL